VTRRLPATRLDEVLPEYHHRERHSTHVVAPPQQVFAAIRSVTLAEMPLARLLMRARGMHAGPAAPVLDEALRTFRILADEPGRELVIGSIGQPWRLHGGARPDAASDFRGFREPGYAKMALSFRLDGATLSTETRVLLTDARARRRFRLYWLAIRPFSGLIRRVWLHAIARRAARSTHEPA
jgi:hypothetical protein